MEAPKDELDERRKRRELKRLVDSGMLHITMAPGCTSSLDDLSLETIQELLEIIHQLKKSGKNL